MASEYTTTALRDGTSGQRSLVHPVSYIFQRCDRPYRPLEVLGPLSQPSQYWLIGTLAAPRRARRPLGREKGRERWASRKRRILASEGSRRSITSHNQSGRTRCISTDELGSDPRRSADEACDVLLELPAHDVSELPDPGLRLRAQLAVDPHVQRLHGGEEPLELFPG